MTVEAKAGAPQAYVHSPLARSGRRQKQDMCRTEHQSQHTDPLYISYKTVRRSGGIARGEEATPANLSLVTAGGPEGRGAWCGVPGIDLRGSVLGVEGGSRGWDTREERRTGDINHRLSLLLAVGYADTASDRASPNEG
ncbi:hypothetical protein WMY93_007777 [Mugilogobius chulae]|uniref:Uncharacterized protein n=1 Tax=Mugilogobius chulae TaxID=88201 RepID=A0AAW0PJ34_9GOBI